MSMSRGVVLLGPRSLGSSFGLIGRRRPFPYRRFSELTNDSKYFQYETDKLRRDMEKMRIELRSEIDKTTNKLSMDVDAARCKLLKYCIGAVSSQIVLAISIVSYVRNSVI